MTLSTVRVNEWVFLPNLVNSDYNPTNIDISLKTTNVFLMVVLEEQSGSPKSLGLEKLMFAQNFVPVHEGDIEIFHRIS